MSLRCVTKVLPLLIPVLISVPIAVAGNATGPVMIIATGKTCNMPVFRAWILTEPSIQGAIVPSRTEGGGDMSREDVKKLLRIYFPRTFEDLITYDFFFLAQVDMAFYSHQQVQWMYDAIEEHGLGGINTRSIMSMNPCWSDPWANSLLSQAFPNDVWGVIGTLHHHKASGRLIVNEDDKIPPVVKPFKEEVEKILGFEGILTIPRPGSKVHTWLKTTGAFGLPEMIPHLFEWDYGRGVTFTALDMLGNAFWQTSQNKYALDIVANIIWHGSHRNLPDDPMKVHFLRKRLQFFAQDKSFIISVFDFIEKFGARTDELYAKILEIQVEKYLADELYICGEFDQSYEIMEDLQRKLGSLSEDAMKLKDEALRWVYFVEWLTVMGTSLLCGGVVWLLMIKRKLYKEVRVTRSDRERITSRRY